MDSEPVDLTCTPKRYGRKRKYAQISISDDVEDEEVSERRRQMANNQERVRMHRINVALDVLKNTLPEEYHPCQRRMSKIRTLRSAMDYIRGLSQLIEQDNVRRQHIYTHAKQYVQTMYGQTEPVADCMYSNMHGISGTTMLTPVSHTAGYPCLESLYTSETGNDNFTPQQTPPIGFPVGFPRHLDFGAPRKLLQPVEDAFTPAESAGNLKNRRTNTGYDREAESGPVMARRLQYRPHRSETFSSSFPADDKDRTSVRSVTTGCERNEQGPSFMS